MRSIELVSATTHNLKNLSLTVQPGTFLVITGPSGAGKTSLAFHTLYAEGQRRYVESFSPYARQFLERLARPPVGKLDPIPAAIAVDRRAQVKTSRSTVGTLTELSDYVRALWAQLSTTVCPDCGCEVTAVTATSVADRVLGAAAGERAVLTYSERVTGPEHYLTVRQRLLADGYRRLWLENKTRDIDTVAPSEALSDGEGEQPVQVVLDRLTLTDRNRSRLLEAIEAAFTRDRLREVVIHRPDSASEPLRYSHALRCDHCGYQATPPTPSMFSFNSPIGACAACRGFGQAMEPDWDKVIPDLNKTLAKGAIRPWSGDATAGERRALKRFCTKKGIPRDVPVGKLSAAQRQLLIAGDGGNWHTGFPGLAAWFTWLETKTYKMHVRVMLARYRKYVPCLECSGTRFKAASLSYKVLGKHIAEFLSLSAQDALAFITTLQQLPEAQRPGTARVLDECHARLSTLCAVGLSYVTLDRAARSLSGGELQRVGLTSALSANLSGTLFVLDEPTVGLHPADVARLLPAVTRLATRDNVVVVVESDEHFISAADRVIALGPASGQEGGDLVYDGNGPQWLEQLAAQHVGQAPVAAHAEPRGWLKLTQAKGHNLQQVDLALPLGRVTCITGVSGSGKSSLLTATLVPAIAQKRGDASAHPLPFGKLEGCESIKEVLVVDQSPLGRTSRGNAATYMGAWDAIRKVFSDTELAQERGYKPGFFSFNVAGGRCEACKGEGSETVEMQFLSDVRFSCPECQGRRFVGPVLDVQVRGRSIADVLELTITEAQEAFGHLPEVHQALTPLAQLGLAYLRLGQPLSTLSGGEGQRLRLAQRLASARKDAQTLLVLDEPTAGLHTADVSPLLATLRNLSAAGATVVVVEHDMRVAAQCDHVIDMGPGPGAAGGQIVAEGAPSEVAKAAQSVTAPFLHAALQGRYFQRNPKRNTTSTKTGQAAELAAVRVRGAREHNLQDVAVDIPREKLVVVTGPSGSGKSTLAFDVIFAESQRRYLETLSPYVRQYLRQLPRPDVDEVVGMPPGVSLEQRTFAGAKNSTVGTVTEVAHYLRVSYARAGTLHCPDCAVPIAPRSATALASDLAARFGRKKVTLSAPVVRGKRGSHRDLLARLRAQGFTQATIDGKATTLKAGLSLDRYKEHDVQVVLGQEPANTVALHDLLQQALRLGDGSAHIAVGKHTAWLSDRRACPSCARGFPELDPRFFSFNTRQGGCPTCEGRGQVEVGRARGKQRNAELRACPDCNGKRLAGLALHTTLGGHSLVDLMAQSAAQAEVTLRELQLDDRQSAIADKAVQEARLRLSFLCKMGLGYLTLDRGADSLSGGELQRVRLSAQLGSGLTGLLYVLDEPTIGLHPRDTGRLTGALRELVDKGCSVLVVEHDADMIVAADYMLDVGPTGGRGGGRLLASGTPQELLDTPNSITGSALAAPVLVPQARRPFATETPTLRLLKANHHNLSDVDLTIPEGRLTCITGVSGSGKSTLIREIFLPAVRRKLGLTGQATGKYKKVEVSAGVRRAVEIDQSPIGRTPRSVPATYVGIWDHIRKLLAATPEARAQGYTAARFSFNTAGGRCPDCEGQGATTVEMSFLPDALVPCETCHGMRFDESTLAITYRGLSAGQILVQDVAQAAELFAPFAKIHRPLALLCDLGLGYLKLGQPSNSLSGGEAQRLKLVSELASTESTQTLYVMDEPTTGLHRRDVLRLCRVIQKLVERGDTVVVIEHHTDLMMQADWLIDLGPEGGSGGGEIIATGTPEQLAKQHKRSHTGAALRKLIREGVQPLQEESA